MRIEKKTVDLNAYISNLECVIKTADNKKQLSFSFKNKNYGIIVAIRLSCVAYDSFDDKIQFEGNEFLEIKRANLQVEPLEDASFSVDVDKYDVKKVEVSVTQLVYANGEKLIPKEPRIVEYEVEVLSSSWSLEDHFEKDALLIMKEKNNRAICFPKIHPEGWICVCGTLNSESENNCAGCGNNKQRVFMQFSKDIIKAEIEDQEKREREEKERRKEQQRIEQEKERRKINIITISAISIIVLAIVIGIVYTVTYNIKYGLSNEEKMQYDIAQKNDRKIEYFVLELGNDFHRIAYKYYDDYSYSHEQKDRMREAEKNEDFLYTRGIYLASSLLYDLIEDQYPEKYRSVYAQLIKLRKSDVYNDILIDETLWIKDSRASDLLDKRDEISKAIDITEAYMDNAILNPAKVEIANTDIPTPDYSKVYGINLGILYYEDGNIRYVGEVSNGQANGFGESWYSVSDGGGLCCTGIFEDGIFKSGDSCYDMEGNKISASELSNMVFAGDFEMIQGLSNTTASSKAVAQQNANNEERDKIKAQAAVEDYLDILVEKQSSITNITWINIPDVSGDYYFFSCTVEFEDLKRKGTITVEKKSDGTFKATGLDFDD